jgi:hypothetical protein
MKEKSIATHVLIAGSVFPREAKAPYVESGHSILGALEYDPATEKVKCHECGRWFKSLSGHLSTHEGLTSREYKRDRGLRQATKLYIPGAPRPGAENLRRWRSSIDPETMKGYLQKALAAAHAATRASALPYRMNTETRNLSSRCKAQLTDRIWKLAVELGRTPTAIELKSAGIPDRTITSVFEMPYMKALASIGMSPNKFNRLRLAGKRFGALTVLEFSHITRRATHWRCKCDCGNETVVKGFHLTSGHTLSCGCLKGIPKMRADSMNGFTLIEP